jgi:beta-galactosidase GanA
MCQGVTLENGTLCAFTLGAYPSGSRTLSDMKRSLLLRSHRVAVAAVMSIFSLGVSCKNNPTEGDGSDVSGKKGVRIIEGRLEIDGKPTFLFGGEVQYFRVRDPGFDAAKTQAMWDDSFTKMRAGGMNLVATYFPWDYHQLKTGGVTKWDFSGARDIDKYLTMACSKGLKVVAKPGPLITAEWPNGFGSYGAIPNWWKEAHPETLALTAEGKPFDFNSLPGNPASVQPTYMHPTYLSAVGEWFDKVIPILRKHIASRCIVSVQVDNETNLYWSDRFGMVDYSETALNHYHEFLQKKYGTVAALNEAYSSSYAALAAVEPPKTRPTKASENIAARDWYDAGQAYIETYLKKIRSMLEARGVKEPDVMFTTNDSPFTIVSTVAGEARNTMMHDGRMKNKVGLSGLDAYPKHIPDIPSREGTVKNFPFQADYFTKLFGFFSSYYTGNRAYKFAYSAELQGGFFSLPFGITSVVTPESTDQLLAKSIGHGMKMGSFYILRSGINNDGSDYDFQAALGPKGEERPRFAVMKRWARFLATHGATLQSAEDVEDPVAILQDVRYQAAQGGLQDDHQLVYSNEYAGLYGWLLNAGFNPAVVDAASEPDLSKYKAVFYLAPQVVAADTAKRLVAFHKSGGMLVQFLDPGSYDLSMKRGPEVSALRALFPVEPDGNYSWPRVPRTIGSGELNDRTSGKSLRGFWYQNYWKPSGDAKIDPFLVERNAVTGANGRTIAAFIESEGAPRALIGTHLATGFNTDAYYTENTDALDARRAIARRIVAKAGVTPNVSVLDQRAFAWGRRSVREKTVYVFVENDQAARALTVEIARPAELGLDPSASYDVVDALEPAEASPVSRYAAQGPMVIPMGNYGTRVLMFRKL